MVACEWAAVECRRYPGIGIGIGRKEKLRLEQTTLLTLLTEAHPALGVTDEDYVYNSQKSIIRYKNGSFILLIDLAYNPSDPEFDRFGSLNLTHCIIEEGGEIQKKARDVFGARRNRLRNTEYGRPGKLIVTTNPSENFMRTEYYDPFVEAGGGRSQKWPIGNVWLGKEKKTAYRAFVHSLVHNNPFIDRNYQETLEGLPPPERKRLLEGDWDYANADSRVIPPYIMSKLLMHEDLPDGPRYAALDVADEGDDQSVLSITQGGVLIKQLEIEVPKGSATSDLIGKRLMDECAKYEIPARNVAVDGLGVGVGVISYCRARGFFVNRYIGGAAAPQALNPRDRKVDPVTYKNVRSAAFWLLGQKAEAGEIHVWAGLPTWDAKKGLKVQLSKIEYGIDNERVLALEPKAKLKAKLGFSPDHADSWNMAVWCQFGNFADQRHNTKRIGGLSRVAEQRKETGGDAA